MQGEGLRLCSALRGERSGINDASRRHPRQRRSVRTLLRDGLIVVPIRIASVSRFWEPDPSGRVRNIVDDWRKEARDIVRWIGAIRVRFRGRPGAKVSFGALLVLSASVRSVGYGLVVISTVYRMDAPLIDFSNSPRIGKTNAIFSSPLPPLASGRGSRAALAASPARHKRSTTSSTSSKNSTASLLRPSVKPWVRSWPASTWTCPASRSTVSATTGC